MKSLNNSHYNLEVAILAGGMSTRMKTDKRFSLLKSKTMLDRAIELVQPLEKSNLYLCGNQQGSHWIADNFPGLGPLAGVEAVLKKVLTKSITKPTWLLVLPVDMPLLDRDILNQLIASGCGSEQHQSKSCIHFRNYELPVLLNCNQQQYSLVHELLLQNDATKRSLKQLFSLQKNSILSILPEQQAKFINVNDPQTLARVNQSEKCYEPSL